jgi:hypothetical protein
MKQIVFGVSARGMTTTMATRDHQIARSRNPEILSRCNTCPSSILTKYPPYFSYSENLGTNGVRLF